MARNFRELTLCFRQRAHVESEVDIIRSGGTLIMAHRDLGGSWELVQSSGHRVRSQVDLNTTTGHMNGQSREGHQVGTFEGTTSDTECRFTIHRGNGHIGNYHGTFDSLGFLSGFVFDQTNPTSQATWVVPDKHFIRIP